MVTIQYLDGYGCCNDDDNGDGGGDGDDDGDGDCDGRHINESNHDVLLIYEGQTPASYNTSHHVTRVSLQQNNFSERLPHLPRFSQALYVKTKPLVFLGPRITRITT
jgi:hypothetical protein